MSSENIATVVNMLESLPNELQEKAIAHLQEYLADLQDEAAGKATPMDCDRAEAEWVEDVREKIDAAIDASRHKTPIDGEPFVQEIIERFQCQKIKVSDLTP